MTITACRRSMSGAFRDWIESGSSNVDVHQSMLDEGRLKFAVAEDLRILLLNKQQVNVLQAFTVKHLPGLGRRRFACCEVSPGDHLSVCRRLKVH